MSTPDKSAVVVLASGNPGKLRELARILAPLDLQLTSQLLDTEFSGRLIPALIASASKKILLHQPLGQLRRLIA